MTSAACSELTITVITLVESRGNGITYELHEYVGCIALRGSKESYVEVHMWKESCRRTGSGVKDRGETSEAS